MKIATWNVNGIRARQAEVQAFLEREQPDVLCLQEIKAALDQLPVWLCDLEGYWCYWHGGKGYSGVGLHVRKDTWPDRPAFHHPEFDHEHRVVAAKLPPATVASVYVPNGGKDFDANEASQFETELARVQTLLEEKGLEHEVRQLVRGNEPAEDLISVANETDADLIVIGLRRRTPVGKLILGSNAQRILLDAPCAVLAVKG